MTWRWNEPTKVVRGLGQPLRVAAPDAPARLVLGELDSKHHALCFPEPLEAAFRDDYFDNSQRANRAAFAVGLFILGAFGLVDIWAAPLSLETVWLIRFGLASPAVVALLILSFAPVYRRIMQPASAIVAFVIGVSITLMVLVARQGELSRALYIFGITPVLAFTYTGASLRFWYATAAGWAIVASSLSIPFGHGILVDRPAMISFSLSEVFVISVNIVGMMGAWFIETSTRRAFVQRLRVEQEEERSEALLLNILPRPVADRLRRGERIEDYFDEVSILFVDIVEFTPLSATITPREILGLLNETFSVFDELARKHGLEKIKTIGDSYMAAAGVPVPCPDHAERVADMALDIVEHIRVAHASGRRSVRVRIGLNTGPVVAGIIGTQKFSYDLWGDTVNTASRMESHSVAGKIRAAEATFKQLQHHYVFEGPDTIEVKGKGRMPTYFLVGKPSAASPTGTIRR
jgi:class 3 adenylate cyclase